MNTFPAYRRQWAAAYHVVASAFHAAAAYLQDTQRRDALRAYASDTSVLADLNANVFELVTLMGADLDAARYGLPRDVCVNLDCQLHHLLTL